MLWQNDGSVAFRANNGRYVITKRSGHLYATSDTVDDNCKYFFYLVNRPILVLKCEQGFVGYKSASSPKLECNKATYETIQVERGEKGKVHFKGKLIFRAVFYSFDLLFISLTMLISNKERSKEENRNLLRCWNIN